MTKETTSSEDMSTRQESIRTRRIIEINRILWYILMNLQDKDCKKNFKDLGLSKE